MERTITMRGRTGRLDVPSFLLTENEDLQVRFDIQDECKGARYYVTVKHGTAQRQTFLLPQDKTLALSAEWIRQGGNAPIEFSMEMKNYLGNVTIRNDYEIEPLLLIETDGEYYTTGAVQALEKRVEALEESLQDEIAAKEEILAKFADFADNGVNVQFTDEENNSNQGENEDEKE